MGKGKKKVKGLGQGGRTSRGGSGESLENFGGKKGGGGKSKSGTDASGGGDWPTSESQ